MSHYRYYPSSDESLIGYFPTEVVDDHHLARLIEQVVEEAVSPSKRVCGKGQPPFDPRVCIKVLIYAYCLGIRSSRQIERLCRESLAFLFLTRGQKPSYRTICTARVKCHEEMELVWLGLFSHAAAAGLQRIGGLVIDSTKFRADASGESVLRRCEYAPVLAEFERLIAENKAYDAREDAEGTAVEVKLETKITTEQTRDMMRRIRKNLENDGSEVAGSTKTDSSEKPPIIVLTDKMRERVEQHVQTIKSAQELDLKHVSLTDPDARMQPEGCLKKVSECHSFEVVMDQGLIVAASVTTQHDVNRLVALVEQARPQEPQGIVSVDADSGYFTTEAVITLEQSYDTCIPDPSTARDIRFGKRVGATRDARNGPVVFTYNEEANMYVCPEGNELRAHKRYESCGQWITDYRAKKPCTDCPLASVCMKNKGAKFRILKVGALRSEIMNVLKRFDDSAHRDRYHRRGPSVETVFGFLRSVLGIKRWQLRGADRVRKEAILFKLAYQFRKTHSATA